jgi:hypothetical protein
MPKTKKWIQASHPKKNALHKQLGIPTSHSIPTKTLNDVIKTDVGKKSHGVTVTTLLKKRALFAKNVRK